MYSSLKTDNSLRIRSRIRDYEVSFIEELSSTFGHYTAKDAFIIIDKGVSALYENQIKHLSSRNRMFIVEASEQNKTLEYCRNLLEVLIQNNIRKNYTLVAIGGGIIQDITAFISSILFRGVPWVFYPTTLLAQADSCIGSKSSINVGEYKNLLGSFYPPSRVYIDVNFLKTLPADAIKSGIGEMLHFYLIAGDKSAVKLMDDYEGIFTAPEALKDYIFSSLQIKKKFIEIDEFDKNERNILNYGHTFGHAIEAVSGYRINHGQAVTMGMDIANYISLHLDYLDESAFESMHQLLAKNIPDFRLGKENIENYFVALSKDKKNVESSLVCILSRGPGSMYKVQIPLDSKLKHIILDYFNR